MPGVIADSSGAQRWMRRVQECDLMRWMLAIALVALAVPALAGNYPASGMRGLTGNDTGGVIEWTPEIADSYFAIAAEHCARWNRLAFITSVHRRYGDFVGFLCVVDRRYDPRKAYLYPPG
jgi:hypothetical protein